MKEDIQTIHDKDPAEPKNIMKKIRHLFQKRDLTIQEIHLLRGILTSLNRKINHD
jgi:tRNA/rRNA methyltransferase/tRNA (cytidine32/uridine32-2'-O)-methyltransferase